MDFDEIIKNKTKCNNNKNSSIYFLLDKNEIVFIGSSSNVAACIKTHEKTKSFDSYFIHEIKNEKNKEKLVAETIFQFCPKYNRTITGHPDIVYIGKIPDDVFFRDIKIINLNSKIFVKFIQEEKGKQNE